MTLKTLQPATVPTRAGSIVRKQPNPRLRHYTDPVHFWRYDDSFRGWANRYANKNHWRVANIIGSEADAHQEAFIVWHRVIKCYAKHNPSPAQMMAAFKVAMVNQWNTFSKKASEQAPLGILVDDFDLVAELRSTDLQQGTLRDWVDELRDALDIMVSVPGDILGWLLDAPEARAQVRQLRR